MLGSCADIARRTARVSTASTDCTLCVPNVIAQSARLPSIRDCRGAHAVDVCRCCMEWRDGRRQVQFPASIHLPGAVTPVMSTDSQQQPEKSGGWWLYTEYRDTAHCLSATAKLTQLAGRLLGTRRTGHLGRTSGGQTGGHEGWLSGRHTHKNSPLALAATGLHLWWDATSGLRVWNAATTLSVRPNFRRRPIRNQAPVAEWGAIPSQREQYEGPVIVSEK